MPPKKTDESPVFQLKVTLKDTKPPIWRRIQVRGSTTLYKLNYILQTSMGWTNSHLHQFTANGIMYGEPDPDWFDDAVSERRVKLGDIVAEEKDDFSTSMILATDGSIWSWSRKSSRRRQAFAIRAA